MHAHGQIVALSKARGNVPFVRLTSDDVAFAAGALRWAVALFALFGFAVQLHKLRVINVLTKHGFDCIKVRAVPVAGQLHAVSEPRRQICNELLRGVAVAWADEP